MQSRIPSAVITHFPPFKTINNGNFYSSVLLVAHFDDYNDILLMKNLHGRTLISTILSTVLIYTGYIDSLFTLKFSFYPVSVVIITSPLYEHFYHKNHETKQRILNPVTLFLLKPLFLPFCLYPFPVLQCARNTSCFCFSLPLLCFNVLLLWLYFCWFFFCSDAT